MATIKDLTITADDEDYDLLVMPINPQTGVPMSVTRLVPGASATMSVGKMQSMRIDVVVRGASSPAEGGLP